jgi:hypothetical protein
MLFAFGKTNSFLDSLKMLTQISFCVKEALLALRTEGIKWRSNVKDLPVQLETFWKTIWSWTYGRSGRYLPCQFHRRNNTLTGAPGFWTSTKWKYIISLDEAWLTMNDGNEVGGFTIKKKRNISSKFGKVVEDVIPRKSHVGGGRLCERLAWTLFHLSKRQSCGI